MKLAFIFNYPLVDNVNWKKEVVQGCLDLGYDVDIYYGKINPLEYIKTYLIKRKFSSISSVSYNLKKKSQKNHSFFTTLKINVFKVVNFNSERSIEKISSREYDYVIAAIDQILSKNFIQKINAKILNIHYATLPAVKGVNAIEWNYLVNQKCELTLHYIDAGIDTGSIIKKQEISVKDEDEFFIMREKLQANISEVLLSFLKNPNARSSPNNGGKLFTYMHGEIQNILKGKA